MSCQQSMFSKISLVLVCMTSLGAVAAASDADAFIRFYTDAGSIVEIENRAMEQNGNYPSGPSTAVATPNNQGLAQEHRIETRAVKQRFCGELLVNALALVCKGNYRKRGDEEFTQDSFQAVPYTKERYAPYEQDTRDYPAAATYNYPEFFEILKNANSINRNYGTKNSNSAELNKAAANGRAKLRPKRGVVDECCKKPCSTVTLSQYCSY